MQIVSGVQQVYEEASGQLWVSFITCLCTWFLRHGFSLVLELDGLTRVVGKKAPPTKFTCRYLLISRAGIPGAHLHAGIYREFFRLELWDSCLYSKRLTHWAFSQSLEARFELRQLLCHRLDSQTGKCLLIAPVLEISILEILLQIPVVRWQDTIFWVIWTLIKDTELSMLIKGCANITSWCGLAVSKGTWTLALALWVTYFGTSNNFQSLGGGPLFAHPYARIVQFHDCWGPLAGRLGISGLELFTRNAEGFLSTFPGSPQPLPKCFGNSSCLVYICLQVKWTLQVWGTPFWKPTRSGQAVQPCFTRSWLAPLFAHKAGLLSNCRCPLASGEAQRT